MQFCDIPGCVEEAVGSLVALEARWAPKKLCAGHLMTVRRFITALARIDLSIRELDVSEQPVGILARLGNRVAMLRG